ncbi:MAG: isochorismatase family protein [Burkholderiales bacterium]|nr:isochorismatase family protein [Burkholderiales bacterium]
MLLQAEQSVLLVVDVQEKLVNAIDAAPKAVAAMKWLIDAAILQQVPVVFSEQYPQALGPTLPCLRSAAPEAPAFEKTAFSCVAAECLRGSAVDTRKQVVICGIEAHVCVLQTALDLHAQGKSVFVVSDAIGSRAEVDKTAALDRLVRAGVTLITREMALFEWLRDSKAPTFKDASKRLLQVAPALTFAEALTTLPSVATLAGLQLWRDGKLEAVIENKPGQAGSLAVYHALFKKFGAITPKGARLGQWLYGEHAADARQNPGKHPNIDRLFALETMGGGYGVRLIPA